MTTPLLSNFAKSVLEEPISMSDLTMQITPADAGLFPAPGANESFKVILYDGVNDEEIVEVTDNSSGLFTIIRGAEGTVARAWDAHTQVRHAITAGVFDYFLAAVTMLSGTSATSVAIGLGSKSFVTQADKLFNIGQWLLIKSASDPLNKFMHGQASVYSGTNLTVNVVRTSGAGTFADWVIEVSGPTGQQGDAGAAGAAGADGADGADGLPGVNGKTIRNGAGGPGAGLGVDGDFYIDTTADAIYGPKTAGVWGSGTSLVGPTGAVGVSPGKMWAFSTVTTDTDPGTGVFKANNGTFGSITKLFIDEEDLAGENSVTWLTRLDDSSNTGDKGLLRVQKKDDPDIYMEFQVTGAVVDKTGYREIPVTPIGGAIPADLTQMVFEFSMTGDAGSAFIGLSDTPVNYTGSALKVVRANAGETAVEFGPVPEALGEVAGINTQIDSYTLVLADKGKVVELNKATAVVLTVPANASVAFPVNTRIDIVQLGAGQVTITPAGGVTINSKAGKVTVGQYTAVTLYKRGTNEWVLIRKPVWISVLKLADETKVSNSGFADDAELVFPLAANIKYSIRGTLFFETTAAADFKYSIAGPASPTLVNLFKFNYPPNSILVEEIDRDTAFGGSNAVTSGATGAGLVKFDLLVHNGVNAGNLAVQWAQNTADASNTILRAGSFLEICVIE